MTPDLVASPASVEFNISSFIPSPRPIELISNVPIGSTFAISVENPEQSGASIPVQTGPTTGVFLIYPISSFGTVVTASDSLGATVNVSVKQDVCGRPDGLLPNSLLIFPNVGSTGVSPTIGRLYFAVFSVGQPYNVGLHLIIGQHGTQEGSPLEDATPPPGSTIVTPIQGETLTYMAGAVPTLQSGAQYRTQIYDDTCQLPILPGAFST